MRKITEAVLILWIVIVCVAADAAPQAAGAAAMIGPFLTDDTVLVVRYDLAGVDFDATGRWAAELSGPLTEAQRQQFVAALERLRSYNEAMRAGGVSQIYLIGTADQMQPNGLPVVVLPIGEGVDAAQVRALLDPGQPAAPLAQQPGCTVEVIGDAVVVGPPPTLKRLRSANIKPRPEWTAALSAGGTAPILVAIVPSEKAIEALGATAALLPPQAGELLKAIGGIRWIGGGISLPPRGGVRFKIQARNADAADTLADAIRAGLEAAVGAVPEEKASSLRQFASVFRPMVMHDRILLSADQKTLGAVLADLVALNRAPPSPDAVAQQALMETGMACLMYAVENGGRFPHSWAQINEKLQHSPGQPTATDGATPAVEGLKLPALVYVRPAQLLSEIHNRAQRLLAYQAFAGEPEAVRVLLVDGTVQEVSLTRFRQLLSLAKSSGGIEVKQ